MVAGARDGYGGDCARAEEVAESLRHGDHLRHDRQLLRSLVAMLLLLLLAMFPKRHFETTSSKLSLVLANPVAHGGRFGLAVFHSLRDLSPHVAADRRLADTSVLTVDTNFPSLSIFSLRGFVTVSCLLHAFRLRRAVLLNRGDYPSLSRVYLECLFIMQAIRYSLAADLVQSRPSEHLWLTDFDRDAYSRPVIWHARVGGGLTATLVHGSPSSNYIPPIAANVLVWGAAQRKWFQQMAPTCGVFAVGRPELTARLSPVTPKNLRIVHSRERLLLSEEKSLERLCALARSVGLTVSLRLHPTAAREDLDSVWLRALGDFEYENNSSNFVESLTSRDITVGVVSTAVLDALASGLPAWTIADNEREVPCDLMSVRKTDPLFWSSVFEMRGFSDDFDQQLGTIESVNSEVIIATGEQSSSLILGAVREILSQHPNC